MPKGSPELTQARKDEIIRACAELYESMSFKDISIQDIGSKTSFSRTSIYNYFHTKEEIFLALLQREHEAWIVSLEQIGAQSNDDALAQAIAHSLEARGCMLKIMCMNLYDVESNSRIENLTEFKQVYVDTVAAIKACLLRSKPELTAAQLDRFIFAFFPFLFGVYPFTVATEKQKAAFERVKQPARVFSIFDLVYPLVQQLLLALKTA